MYPAALFFIAVGVYSTNNSLFEVGEVLVFGLVGALLVALEFPLAPILLGFVLGPMLEQNFRRALLLSHGDLSVFVTRPISGAFIAASVLLILIQIYARSKDIWMKKSKTHTTPQRAECVTVKNDA